jgi:hypothetical protein
MPELFRARARRATTMRSRRPAAIGATIRLLAALALLAGCTTSQGPMSATQAPPRTPASYGVVYPYPEGDWDTTEHEAIRERLGYVQALGVNTVIEAFSAELIGTGNESNWLVFLDEAERAGIQVIARLYPEAKWDGRKWDLDAVQSFLSVVQGHPALQALLGLHEPFEQYTGEQLRKYYSSVKGLAPELPIAHYMGDMTEFDKSWRYPGREVTSGICDICIVWHAPAIVQNNRAVFEEKEFRRTLRDNLELIRERAPGAELWALGQAYSLSDYDPPLRMPTPKEMAAEYRVAEEEQVDGFLWYVWVHNLYDEVLGDPAMAPQRQVVQDVYRRHE